MFLWDYVLTRPDQKLRYKLAKQRDLHREGEEEDDCGMVSSKVARERLSEEDIGELQSSLHTAHHAGNLDAVSSPTLEHIKGTSNISSHST